MLTSQPRPFRGQMPELSAGKAPKYAEISAAIRAMKSRMLGDDGRDALLTSSSSSECMSILREQGYFETATGEAFDQPSLWQTLLDTKMRTIIEKLIRLSPPECRQLLEAFDSQYRLELLKSGLRVIAAREEDGWELGIEEAGSSTDLLRSVVESRNVELLIQHAAAKGLESDLSTALAEKRPLALLEAMVDKYALTRMWKAADMGDSLDRQAARALIGELIDLLNLLLVLRSKTLKITEAEVQEALIPVNYRLGENLSEAASAGSVVSALRVLAKTTYADQVGIFLDSYKEDNTLHPLDVSLRRRHAASCNSVFSGFPFSAGLPLAFAYLIAYETSDVRSIIAGKHDGVSKERIQEFLIL